MGTSRELAISRSGGQCEAMVAIKGVFTRCGKRPVDCHHRIRRSQGGGLLDQELESEHLICLCRTHHEWAHRNVGLATEAGLFIEGQVIRDGTRMIYKGSHQYFLDNYGEEVQYEIRGLAGLW